MSTSRRWLNDDGSLYHGPYACWQLSDVARYDPAYLRDLTAVQHNDIADDDRDTIVEALTRYKPADLRAS